MQGVRPINERVHLRDAHKEASLIGDREIADDLLLCNCFHHLIIQEYLKRMQASLCRREFDSFGMLIGKYGKAEALCSQPAGKAPSGLLTRTIPAWEAGELVKHSPVQYRGSLSFSLK